MLKLLKSKKCMSLALKRPFKVSKTVKLNEQAEGVASCCVEKDTKRYNLTINERKEKIKGLTQGGKGAG
jgi:hypothetical protein